MKALGTQGKRKRRVGRGGGRSRALQISDKTPWHWGHKKKG